MEAPLVGFTGPRRLPELFLPQVLDVVAAIAKSGRAMIVGCAHGLDDMVRHAVKTCHPTASLEVLRAHEQCPRCKGAKNFWDQESPETGYCNLCRGTGCRFGENPARFARRSMAMVQKIATAGKGSALIGFPDRKCPINILPDSHWISGRPVSGTWSSLAFAAGSGVPVFLSPCTTGDPIELCPESWMGAWPVAAAEGLWSTIRRFKQT